MKVRLTDNLGGIWTVGRVVDYPDETARYLIENGQAVALDEVRAAVVAPPRNAAKRTGKLKPRKAV